MVKDTDISLGDLADNALLVLFANGSKPAAMELTRRLGPNCFAMPIIDCKTNQMPKISRKRRFCDCGKSRLTGNKIRHRFQPGFIGLLIICALIGCARDAHRPPLMI